MLKRPIGHPRPVNVGATAAAPLAMPGAALALSRKIIFLGASTGGTEAIRIFLQAIPARCPPIMVVQHMPESFTGSFAKRLDHACAAKVVEAQRGDVVVAGHVYIAPGHSHMEIKRAGGDYVVDLHKTPPVNRHRPSVDVLFHSAASLLGANAVGVLLTGMGKDGAEGLVAMRKAGARTFAQDEASCVVFGMPREAIVRGGAGEVVALDDMAQRVLAVV